tara:strand:- start:11377 stop:11913 length:537 start_codon:yes stop_codon:yes gene_type:complete
MRGRSPHEYRTESLALNHKAKVKKATTDITAIKAKTDHISVSQAVNLDTMETQIATNVSAIPASLSARLTALEAKMQFIPKAFGRFTTVASPALYATSYNVASISRSGAGQYAVVIDTDMTTANYTVLLSFEDSSGTIMTVISGSHATTGFSIAIRNASNALSDDSESVSFAVFENNT